MSTIMISNGVQKRFVCQYCDRHFARSEHRLRHERTHTKEKPYRCAQCPQAFARTDLLVRHNRLSHEKPADSEQGRGASVPMSDGPSSPSGSPEETSFLQLNETNFAQPVTDVSVPTNQSQPHYRDNDPFALNATSMAAEQSYFQEMDSPCEDPSQHHADDGLTSGPLVDFSSSTSLPQRSELFDVFDPQIFAIYDESLGSWADETLFSNHIMQSQIAAAQPIPYFSPKSHPNLGPLVPPAAPLEILSRHEQADGVDTRAGFRPHTVPSSPVTTFSEISSSQMERIANRLQEFDAILPANWRMPTRLAMSRYLNAFVTGYHAHMPFLHLPTLSVDACPVHLLLAIAATGAFYRFEPEEGNMLFGLTEAVCMEELRRSDNLVIDPQPTLNHAARGPDVATVVDEEEDEIEAESFIPMMQSLLLLMAIGTWSKHESMSRKALRLQSILAIMVRRHCLKDDAHSASARWEDWAQAESAKRTKLIIFGFMNLQSILYDIPSPIRPADINLSLPCTAQPFEARTAVDWTEAQSQALYTQHPFQESLIQFLQSSPGNNRHRHSALGHYILIHALLQHMFYLRELSTTVLAPSPEHSSTYLTTMERALRHWQTDWQQHSSNSHDFSGPVAFNCIALLRVAHIRMNLEAGACRTLESRDPIEIARALLNARRPPRSSHLLRAVTHSAYALSIPIKIGLRFVAQTQPIFWSIQHSLCSFESAVLLSAWLDSLANQDTAIACLSGKEKRLIDLVQSLLEETTFGQYIKRNDANDRQFESVKLRHLSSGVVKVWAQTFCGLQTWGIVNVLGSSLDLYAQLLEAGRD